MEGLEKSGHLGACFNKPDVLPSPYKSTFRSAPPLCRPQNLSQTLKVRIPRYPKGSRIRCNHATPHACLKTHFIAAQQRRDQHGSMEASPITLVRGVTSRAYLYHVQVEQVDESVELYKDGRHV